MISTYSIGTTIPYKKLVLVAKYRIPKYFCSLLVDYLLRDGYFDYDIGTSISTRIEYGYNIYKKLLHQIVCSLAGTMVITL